MSLGALSAVSARHLRRHFAEAARGTPVEGARVDIRVTEDLTATDADALRIDSIEVEPCLPVGGE
jgi:Zn finger protein HypA/HybF involved in hydrogenase expression